MSALYISDLDGTLLTNSATLSKFSAAELQRLLDEGIDFSVASARSVVAIGNILRDLRLKLPVIELNGAFISDLETGRHEVVNAIDSDIVGDLYELIVRQGNRPFVSTFSGTEDCLYYCDLINEGMRWYVGDRTACEDKRLRKVNDARSALREQVVCLTSIGPREPLSELAASVHEKYSGSVETHLFENHYSPGWHWLTIHDRRATKDQAVRVLMDMLGLGDRELVVFGDQVNDLKLFGIATEAVAVGNAVPEVIEQATRVIGTNEEDSVVKYIGEHWRGRRSKAPQAEASGASPVGHVDDIVRFSNAPELFVKADRLFVEVAATLRDALPHAEIHHVGSTAIPGSLTKGDLDIVVRTTQEAFDHAERVLTALFARNAGSFRSNDFSAFLDSSTDPALGVQLVAVGSPADTFLEWRQLLERDDEIRRRYDDLKRRFEGESMEAYREAKARFIAECLGMRNTARGV